ncbi:MAG: FecR domain-containing protein [Opitutales bacterium]
MSDTRKHNTPPPESASKETLIAYGRDCAMDGLIRALKRHEGIHGQPDENKVIAFKPTAWISAIAAVLIISVAAVFIFNPFQGSVDPNQVLRVAQLEGSVTKTSAAGKSRDLAIGDSILPGDTITTAPNAHLVTSLSGGTQISIEADSIFSNKTNPESQTTRTFALDQGFAKVEVVQQAKGSSLRFELPKGEVEVVGTVFTLKADEAFSEVSVLEGVVDFTSKQEDPQYEKIRVFEGIVSRLYEGETELEYAGDANETPQITGFSVIDVETHAVLKDISPDNATFSPSEIIMPAGGIAILVKVDGPVQSVNIRNRTLRSSRVEAIPPFTLSADSLHIGGGYVPLEILDTEQVFRIIPSHEDTDGEPVFLRIGAQ